MLHSKNIRMRVYIILSIAFFLFGLSNLALAEDISYAKETITVGKSRLTLNLLYIPNNGKYSFEITNSSPIGSVKELKTLVDSKKAIAGINGTFFDAYSDNSNTRYPYGILINWDSINKEVIIQSK